MERRHTVPRRKERQELLRFRWPVPEGGFAVETGGGGLAGWEPSPLARGPYLRPVGEGWRSYSPLEKPLLFKAFADLDGSEEAIRRFASAWGSLEGGVLATPGSGNTPNKVEFLSAWRTAIGPFRIATQLQEWLTTSDRVNLGRHIIWDPHGRVWLRYRSPGGDAASEILIAMDDRRGGRELYRRWKVGDRVGPAWVVLVRLINEGLAQRAAPRLAVELDGADYHIHPVVEPKNLLGALWTQLWMATSGDIRLVRCMSCGEWMDVSDNRATKRIHDQCSEKERKRRYRAKLRRASPPPEGAGPHSPTGGEEPSE